MPHVTVIFVPSLVDQALVDKLKTRLQYITSAALSDHATIPRSIKGFFRHTFIGFPKDIAVALGEIFVRQEVVHKTDVNPAPIEVVVDAGRSKGRDPDLVARRISLALSAFLPSQLCGEDQTCVWVRFHERNGFCYTRKQ